MSRKNEAGFSLVEVTLALGIVAFCLLTLAAMLPIGLQSNAESIQQTAAANIATALLSDLKIPLTTQASPQFGLVLPIAGDPVVPHTLFLKEDGSRTGTVDAASAPVDARYRVNLSFTAPAKDVREATMIRIYITWPAAADPQSSLAPKSFAGSFEVVTALDRN